MNQLITFFMGRTEEGKPGLAGIGLTDEMLELIKQKGVLLQENKAGDNGLDILIVHGKTVEDIIATVQKMAPHADTDVRMI